MSCPRICDCKGMTNVTSNKLSLLMPFHARCIKGMSKSLDMKDGFGFKQPQLALRLYSNNLVTILIKSYY